MSVFKTIYSSLMCLSHWFNRASACLVFCVRPV